MGIGATTHWPALSPEPQVTEMERAFLTLVPNLWKTREQVKCQLLPPLQLRPKREPKKVKNRLFLLIKIGQVLGHCQLLHLPDTKNFVLSGVSLRL